MSFQKAAFQAAFCIFIHPHMKKIKLPAYLLCVAVLVIAGYHNLVRIDNLEIRFFEISRLNWILIPFIVRILTASFFFIPALILLSKNKMKIASQLLALLLLLILIWDQYYSFHYQSEEVETINFSATTWLPAIVSIIALALLLLLSLKDSEAPLFFSRKILCGLIVTISIVLPFIINPVFPDNFTIEQTDLSAIHAADLISKFPTDDTQLVCFFTASCPYCRKNSKKIYLRLSPEERKKVLALFPSQKEKVELFFEDTHTGFEYQPEMGDVFKEYQVHRWPTFFLVKNNKIINRWDGNTFNYAVLNDLPKLLQ
jgi:thioredoxin-related protein